MKDPVILSDAYLASAHSARWRLPKAFDTRALCPSCGAFSQFELGYTEKVLKQNAAGGKSILSPPWQLGIAHCVSCESPALFFDGKQIFPAVTSPAPRPHKYMPAEVVGEYEEAAAVVQESPRAAAAMLRLALQKILPVLGAKAKGIDAAVKELVANGKVAADIQQALDTLRVIGNESVHPGELNLNDDRPTALALFDVLNFIVDRAIAEPRKIAEMYARLPDKKRQAIELRDKQTAATKSED